MRISDWSSDVCSSDLALSGHGRRHQRRGQGLCRGSQVPFIPDSGSDLRRLRRGRLTGAASSVVERSEEHTSELQALKRIESAVFCLQKKNSRQEHLDHNSTTRIPTHKNSKDQNQLCTF